MKIMNAEDLLSGYVPMDGLNQDTPIILSVEEFHTPSEHVRISGRFGEGADTQFNIFLPPEEQWKGRFWQRVHPTFGLDNRDLAFDLYSGTYSVTVQIGLTGHVFQASAAHVSRTIAKNYYEYNEKIYGYICGGSGGSMQVIGALEMTTGLVWDGAVPYIVAAPASMGNYDIKRFACAVLAEKAPLIADAMSPGGSGDPYAVLNDLESAILKEVTLLGFPLIAWENYEYLFLKHEKTGLIDNLNAAGEINEEYTYAFWNEPGYLEAYEPELRSIFYNLRNRGVSEGALAKIAYHRHKDPGPTFYTWNHLRDSNGVPLFAQTPGAHHAFETSKSVSGGAEWSGNINYKTISVVNQMDQEAFPSDGDYYRERVKSMGREADYRIWFNENTDHNDYHEKNIQYLGNRLIDFTGILFQALLDLSAWVERGEEPPNSTSYSVVNSQLIMTETGVMRGGIQPGIELTVNDAVSANITTGESVNLSSTIQVPQGTGEIVSVEWDFLGNGDFVNADFEALPDGSWVANTTCTYDEEGTYLPQVRVASQREGDPDTPYARIYNHGRVRVVVMPMSMS